MLKDAESSILIKGYWRGLFHIMSSIFHLLDITWWLFLKSKLQFFGSPRLGQKICRSRYHHQTEHCSHERQRRRPWLCAQSHCCLAAAVGLWRNLRGGRELIEFIDKRVSINDAFPWEIEVCPCFVVIFGMLGGSQDVLVTGKPILTGEQFG